MQEKSQRANNINCTAKRGLDVTGVSLNSFKRAMNRWIIEGKRRAGESADILTPTD
jgi:uncharacterized protein YjhX (UPF0386 family)